MDYKLVFAKGQLDDSHVIYKASVSFQKTKDSKYIPVIKIGEVKIEYGFGSTVEKATDNFISRNSANLIDKIFDVVDV